MNKYIVFSIIFALAIVGLSHNAHIVRAEAEGTIPAAVGSNISEGAPSVVGSNGPEGEVVTSVSATVTTGTNANETGAIIPSNGGTIANETGAIVPNTGGTNVNETGAIIPNSVGSNGPEGTFTPPVEDEEEPPVTPPGGSPDNNVNNTSGGGSSGGSRRSGGSSIVVTTTPVVTSPVAFTSIGTCPLITDYLKLGGNNNPTQVTKLQSFLKNVEKLNVDVSGVFDQKTEDAVKAFQLKYLPTVLGPWSATRATGNVYITTVKKINEIVCATPFVLSASDLAIIEAYNQGGTTADGQPIEIGVTDETGSSTDVGTTDGTEDNTDVAAAGGASILSRFWSFIKSLFR